MNIIDRFIGFVDPGLLAKRLQARHLADTYNSSLQKKRKYEAAAKTRRTDTWVATGTSANQEILAALVTLRDRSRDMTRNNVYARRAVQLIANNVVGTGIMPRPEGSEALKKKLNQLWKEFAETTLCDFDNLHNMYGLQKLAMLTVCESGEVIIRVRRRQHEKFPYYFQICEGDYIDHSKNNPKLDNGGYIRMGVEFDKEGKKVGYWLYNMHPAEGQNIISTFVPIKDVLHIFKCERPGQIRGVPFGVASMIRLKDFDDYEDAELMRQKIAACFTAFVTDPTPSDITDNAEELELAEKIQPGAIEIMPPGKEITFASPPATNGYAEYTRKILQGIASGYGATYEGITGDLSNVNFSSGRMGWIEFHRNIEDWQYNMLIPMLCNKVWDLFMDSLVLSGLLKETQKVPAQWTPPRRQMIDPAKEIKGMSDEVRNGFTSWSEQVRAQGFDPQDVLEELSKDFKNFKDKGLVLACDPSNDAGKSAEIAANSQSNKGEED